MKTINCWFALMLLSAAAQSQMPLGNYWDTWYMHDQVSLEFTAGLMPVVVLDSCPMSFGDFIYTVTDPVSGKVAFSISTDEGVLDGNGDPVAGGSGFIDHGSTHVIPHPGDATLYYLFWSVSSITYSLLQVDVQAGTAAFVPDETDVLLATGVGSDVGICSAPDGIDHWLLLHHYSDSTLLTYNVNAGVGLVTTPVVQSLSQALPVNVRFKCSPDNTKLLISKGNGNFLLHALDPATGLLGEAISISVPGGGAGGEFSPNAQVLYVTRFVQPDSARWLQFDLSSGDETTINNSAVLLDLDGIACADGPPGMQLAPDGRIYCILAGGPPPNYNYYETHLAIIHYPNTIGVGCQLDTVGLNMMRTGMIPYSPPKAHWFGTPLSAVEADFVQANASGSSLRINAVPNPASAWLDISLQDAAPSGTRVELLNTAGQQVWNERWRGGSQNRVVLPSLSAGMYTLRMTTPSGVSGKTRITIAH
ncbi:MAG: T9SS type A sorting domain-containing protein [Flavobacteriales bacterium]|nr:MAG: T9SS type A sorting domain-containing protein [Flavobacteriales bacterium]